MRAQKAYKAGLSSFGVSSRRWPTQAATKRRRSPKSGGKGDQSVAYASTPNDQLTDSLGGYGEAEIET